MSTNDENDSLNRKNTSIIDPLKTGEFIRRIRLELGMTQSDLAKDLFITRKAVSKWV